MDQFKAGTTRPGSTDTGSPDKASPDTGASLNSGFYRDLTAVKDFSLLLNLDTYQPVPDDWYVLVADVVNSTGAILNNRYQDVNTLGASCIIAVLNACEKVISAQCDAEPHPSDNSQPDNNQTATPERSAHDAGPEAAIHSRENIPYVFGGDGASFCIPPCYLDAALAALKGTQKVSTEAYNLELRTGFVAVSDLRAAGHELLVSKMQVSDHAFQAAFAGSGMTEAEVWLKKDPVRYAIPDSIPAEADFSGLQCRWDRIPSPRDETVSLLIESRCTTLAEQSRLYQDTMAKITEIYGDRDQHHPLQANNMQMTFSNEKLRTETRLYSAGKSWLYKLGYAVKIRFIALMGSIMMATNMVANGYNWGGYKEDMIRHSDHRKFDNMLRMVLAGTPEQRAQLEDWLSQQLEKGVLYYGISTSEAALLTCLVFQHGHDHFHFVDGADGGYALAATHLKKQRQAENRSEPQPVTPAS
ncbi:MAG: DUF3095 domain-containing protein [Oceanospirillum sp.]|nr:DUF3095 domain-containing protein [Oceanospirillum sp.]